MKLFALVLAVLIWTTVHDMIQGSSGVFSGRTRTLSGVPVWVLVPATEGHGFRVEPSTVEVTVRGPRDLLDELAAEDLRAVVEMAPGQMGRSPMAPVEVVAPPGVTVVRVVPSRVRALIPPD
ncbi:MAG: CdaR family protein [Verrucomicrobiota bacterium]|nr:CdaR family protein [Limisphaera sp.]MDW8382231.1 CdaR family protein [Verrucomicrobiota bacterium]